jgi:hypothetical protein
MPSAREPQPSGWRAVRDTCSLATACVGLLDPSWIAQRPERAAARVHAGARALCHSPATQVPGVRRVTAGFSEGFAVTQIPKGPSPHRRPLDAILTYGSPQLTHGRPSNSRPGAGVGSSRYWGRSPINPPRIQVAGWLPSYCHQPPSSSFSYGPLGC